MSPFLNFLEAYENDGVYSPSPYRGLYTRWSCIRVFTVSFCALYCRSFDARPWYRVNDSQNEKAKRAYRAVKTVSLRRLNTPAYKQFQTKVQKLAHNTYHYKEKTGKDYKVIMKATPSDFMGIQDILQMNNFISSFYDAVLLYAIALNETLEAGGNIRNGTEITRRMWNRTFEG